MMKFLFEHTKEEIQQACEGYEDCIGCKFMYHNGVCALDIVSDTNEELKDLLKFLLREIDYDNLRVVSGKVEQERTQGESQKKDNTLCEE